MSGRSLGRLLGSLLVLAAAAIIGLDGGLGDIGGDLRTMDLIWTISPETAIVAGR